MEGGDPHNRLERQCQSNEKLFRLNFVTDNYGYETSWSLEKQNGSSWTKIMSGPPGSSKYADNTQYMGSKCLVGDNTYRLTINDSNNDGFCCRYGKGTYSYSIDEVVQYDSTFTDTFDNKAVHQFIVGLPILSQQTQLPASGRDGVSPFCGENKQQIRVEIFTDDYGEENSWELRDLSSNRVVVEVPLGKYGPGTRDKVEVCVRDGTYRFTMTDGIGDGICCKNGKGFYKLYLDGEILVNELNFNNGKARSNDVIVGYSKQLVMTHREQEYLAAHNWRRKKWHEDKLGVDYVPLRWSMGLAEHAKNRADELLKDCDIDGIEHEPGIDQGENLAKNTGSGSWGQLYPVENIVRRWVEREEGWSFPDNAHLTQALWRSSHYVGCAEAGKGMNAKSGAMCRIQVCRYARAGNCNMSRYEANKGENWKIPMLSDDNPCGPACPPEGCHD